MSRKRLKYIAYFAMTLLLLNSGLATAAYTLASQLSDEPQRILMCTSEGLKWVVITDLELDNNGGKNNGPHVLSALEHCPFCHIHIVSLDSHVDNSALSISLNPCYSRLHRFDLIHFTLADTFLLSRLPARAPPIIA